MLLERPGEIVTREEMRKELWPADTFVDFDHGLNSAVARLREALDDSADEPQFIETVPRQGYRFIAHPEMVASSIVPAAASSDLSVSQAARARWSAWLTALIILASFGVGRLITHHRERPLPSVELAPLAGMRGYEADPSFSPDGSQVAFDQYDGENSGIYTALVDGEKPLQLTKNQADCCPAWSPDHRQVAFLRFLPHELGLYIVPALGGTERRLYTMPPPLTPGLAWSPDGHSLAFVESSRSSGESWITLLLLSDSTRRQLTFPPHEARDAGPAFSPDGSQVAFVRGTIAGVAFDVFVVPTVGGEAKRLTFDNCPNFGVTWTADGRDIVFASPRGGQSSLWRVPASGGAPQPVAGAGSPAKQPSIAREGNLLAYRQAVGKDDIARISLADPARSQGPPTVLISEKGSKLRPRFSPDGSKIAFESDRLGSGGIWICDSTGGNCAQATSLHGTAGTTAWSPDGRFLAFEFHPGEQAEIYVVELPNGVPQLIRTIPGADNLAPSWSRDGKWIYFSSKKGDAPFQLWKVGFKGGAPAQVSAPVQVTRTGGLGAVESSDGRFLYYSKYETVGVWRMPLGGGDETRIFDQPVGPFWFNWTLSEKGIYFVSDAEFPHRTVNFFDFATHKVAQLVRADKPLGWGLTLAPGGKSLLYVQTEFEESDIMLVKNFH